MAAAEEAAQRATLEALAAAIRQQRALLKMDADSTAKNDLLARVG